MMTRSMIAAAMTLVLALPALANEECEDTVDMADSLDFHKMHVDCDDDPVTLYDPKSKTSFFSSKNKVVDTYDNADTASKAQQPEVQATLVVEQDVSQSAQQSPLKQAAAPAVSEATESNAGVIFNIREPFTLTGGPHSALNGLYTQMATHCPAGWEKLKEWSVPNATGFFLHYQFQCAE